jgi:hypothetical protein
MQQENDRGASEGGRQRREKRRESVWARMVAAGIVFMRREMAGGESGKWRLRPRNARAELRLLPFPFLSCLVVFVHGVAWVADADRGIESPRHQSPAPGLWAHGSPGATWRAWAATNKCYHEKEKKKKESECNINNLGKNVYYYFSGKREKRKKENMRCVCCVGVKCVNCNFVKIGRQHG